MELFARTLQTLEPKTREQVVELKATLWALVSTPGIPPGSLLPTARQIQVTETIFHGVIFFQGHVGSTNWGINFLVEEAVIPEIVRLAEECGDFAIRGYDVLNNSFLIKECL